MNFIRPHIQPKLRILETLSYQETMQNRVQRRTGLTLVYFDLYGRCIQIQWTLILVSLHQSVWRLMTNVLRITFSLILFVGTSLALISPVIRGLSELFLVVENVAQVSLKELRNGLFIFDFSDLHESHLKRWIFF